MDLPDGIVFDIIRYCLANTTGNVVLSDKEYYELIEIGKKQSILPIIYCGLKNMGWSQNQLKAISDACNKDLFAFIQQNEALKKVGSVFDQAEIPYIFLKGAILRNLYPSPEMRTSHDIDVLVHEQDINQAIEILESSTDFKLMKQGYHDFTLLNGKGVQLELHFNIKENAENIDRLLEKAWDYAEPVGKELRFEFTNEFQVFYITAHMSHHFLHGGLGIRPFIDLWLLRKKTVYDEATVRDMCSECGILKFYEECCNLSEVWLGDQKHTETTKMLEQFCLSGGVFGSAEFKNAARQREQRGVKYILSRVFPPAYQVKEFYKDDSGKEHILPYYYVKRWLSWGSKARRKEMNKQIHSVLNIDRSYLDSAEELLARLGF